MRPRRSPWAGLLPSLSLALLLVGRGEGAPAPEPKLDLKRVTDLAQRWFQARPKTCFASWDPTARAALLVEAAGFGPLPEGSLPVLREALWKVVRKLGPSARTPELDTPYGKATWIQKGGGGPKSGLILGLHGGGEGAGDAGEAAGKWVASGHLGLYPQGLRLVHDTWNTVHGERFLLTLLEIAKAQHEIDPDRVYAMGFSMGGTGSWFLAGRHPDLLAGAIPAHGVHMARTTKGPGEVKVNTAAEVEEIEHGQLPNVRNLALWWYTGHDDRNCNPGTYLKGWELLLGLRAADPTGYRQLEFKAYPGVAHAFPAGEPSAGMKWILDKRREPFPARLTWETNTEPAPFATADDEVDRLQKRWFYWLHCVNPVDRMHVVAARAGNTFDLEVALGYAGDFTLYLNPTMIDVQQDVVVRVGGKEVYRGRPAPDLACVLESLDARLDRTLLFDRRVRLE